MADPIHVWEFLGCHDNFTYKALTQDETISAGLFLKSPERCSLKWEILIELTHPRHQLDLYGCPDGINHDGATTVVFKRKDSNPRNVTVSFSCVLKNILGHKYEMKVRQNTTPEVTFTDECKEFRFPPLGRPTARSPFYLMHNRLLIEGKIKVEHCCSNDNLDEVLEDCASKLLLDYKNLSLLSEFADVRLQVGEEELSAHKCILSARCPIFYEKWCRRVGDKDNNEVIIPDVQKPILKEFLTFIYTGSLTDTRDEMVRSLYNVAAIYKVETLRKVCSAYLISSLGLNSACDVLKLAHTHSDYALKGTAMDWICEHYSEVLLTDSWKELLETGMSLVLSVYQRCRQDE